MQNVKNFDAEFALPLRNRRAGDNGIFAPVRPTLDVDHFHPPVFIGDHKISRAGSAHAIVNSPALLDQPRDGFCLGYGPVPVPVVPTQLTCRF